MHQYVGCPEIEAHIRPPTYTLEEANRRIVNLNSRMEGVPHLEAKLTDCMDKIVSAQEKERLAWKSLFDEKSRQVEEMKVLVQNLGHDLHALQMTVTGLPSQPYPGVLGADEFHRLEGMVHNLEQHCASHPP